MDDCHWLDAASAAIIEEAIGDLADSPLGWLLVHRPGWAPPASWPVNTRITLQPLDARTSGELAHALLGPSASDESVAFVVDRAEGNPLYLVELCSAVAEAGMPAEPRQTAETAAQPSHDLAARRPFDDFDVNAVGTLNLLESVRQFTPESVFVSMSTNKVYGDRPNTIALKELETRFDYADPTYEQVTEGRPA